MNVLIASLAARESAGGASPGWYLPVSTPSASGDQTICLMPWALRRARTASASGARQSIEYCGWELTNGAAPATARPASICSGVHSLKPR